MGRVGVGLASGVACVCVCVPFIDNQALASSGGVPVEPRKATQGVCGQSLRPKPGPQPPVITFYLSSLVLSSPRPGKGHRAAEAETQKEREKFKKLPETLKRHFFTCVFLQCAIFFPDCGFLNPKVVRLFFSIVRFLATPPSPPPRNFTAPFPVRSFFLHSSSLHAAPCACQMIVLVSALPIPPKL